MSLGMLVYEVDPYKGVELTAIFEVCSKVYSFSSRVRIASVNPTIHEPLVSHGNHVRTIKDFDIRSSFCGPGRHNRRRASIATRLIGQLPGENCRAGTVATDYCLYICLVLRLNSRVGIPSGLCGTIVGIVSLHPAIIAPVVDEVDDQLVSMRCSARNDIVEALKAVYSCVDLWWLTGDE